MKLNNSRALSFDDILLVPSHSNITSRLDPKIDLSTRLTRNVRIGSPIVSTNMSTITEEDMLVAMNSIDSVGFLHRFKTIEGQEQEVFSAREKGMSAFVLSIGVKPSDYDNLERVIAMNPTAILIDIAHGDSKQVTDMLKHIKTLTNIDVIAGNIATADAYLRMVDAGADAVRVGIGGGGACTTRKVTGFGLPTLHSIMECAKVAIPEVPIIADGGIRGSNDIVKSLAAGASSVCLGSILAGTSHTPGPLLVKVGNRYDATYNERDLADIKKTRPELLFKEYYGMSSEVAQNKFRGGMRPGVAAEGIHKYVPYTGSTLDTLHSLLGGLKSGLTYQGVYSIPELQNNAEYVILAPGAVKESKH